MPAPIPPTMTAVMLTGHGGFEALQLRHDVPVPSPGPGQVLIEVAATYPLEDIVTAQTAFLAKGFVGKLVLVPPPVGAR